MGLGFDFLQKNKKKSTVPKRHGQRGLHTSSAAAVGSPPWQGRGVPGHGPSRARSASARRAGGCIWRCCRRSRPPRGWLDTHTTCRSPARPDGTGPDVRDSPREGRAARCSGGAWRRQPRAQQLTAEQRRGQQRRAQQAASARRPGLTDGGRRPGTT